ncbi:eukaryotic translation initiation factor 3 subunit J [Pyronema omphalodes]|nr:eukaryotic translation initiation factor 3 subunit J [Pyronema omphalodes]
MAPPKKFDDEEESEDEVRPTTLAPKKKWDDEEESDDDVLDSWDAAEDSEVEREKEAKKAAAAEKAAAEALANKKSTAERIAEKKAANAAKKAAEEAEAAALANETPAERRARMQAREVEADLAHAEDLFGAVGIGAGAGTSGRGKPIAIVDPKDPTKSIDLGSFAFFNPTTKSQFDQLREVMVPLLTKHTKKPHYNLFMQEFARGLCKEMSSDQIKLVASKLTTLSNEKQKEEKEAQKGGKKKTAPKKAALAAAGKSDDKAETQAYDNYDDFDDFM